MLLYKCFLTANSQFELSILRFDQLETQSQMTPSICQGLTVLRHCSYRHGTLKHPTDQNGFTWVNSILSGQKRRRDCHVFNKRMRHVKLMYHLNQPRVNSLVLEGDTGTIGRKVSCLNWGLYLLQYHPDREIGEENQLFGQQPRVKLYAVKYSLNGRKCVSLCDLFPPL